MLEQIAYQIPRSSEQRQAVYRVGDLESLSASALYYGSGGSPLGSLGSFGIVSTPSMKSVGSSEFLTSLRIDNIAKLSPLDRGDGIPTSPSSFGYFSATGKPLGTLEQLNYEEMTTLLKKYSKKYSEE